MSAQGKAFFFEDYVLGEKGETSGRTLSEGDLTAFAAISGDFAPAHMDRHFMEKWEYGARIGHGWLSTSLIFGMLSYHAPYIVGRDTPAAYFKHITVDYPHGFRLGDSVHLVWNIKEKEPDADQAGFGIIKTAYQLLNQHANVVCEGIVTTVALMRVAQDAKAELSAPQPMPYVDWNPDLEKVYFLEDLIPGEGDETYGRTITETDVVNFMGLTQDYNRLYLDESYARQTVIGQTMAPPLLAPVMAAGFAFLYSGNWFKIKKPAVTYAGHLREEILFHAPAKIGDHLHCRRVVEAVRVSQSKPDRGIITFKLQVINQKDEVLAEICTLFMVPTQAVAEEPFELDWVLTRVERNQHE